MMDLLTDKIAGCLAGAVMGTEMGLVNMPLVGYVGSAKQVNEAFETAIDWDNAVVQAEHNVWSASLTPLIQIMSSAYIKKQGRITPEDFAAELATDESLAERKAFWYLDLYSAIERLRMGMEPRINGIGACPDGNICTAMAAVGAYHAKDPEYAYIDGLELASVIQRKPATEWAALTAAAVAESLNEDCTADKLVKKITGMAFKYCKDVYYEIIKAMKEAPAGDGFYGYYAKLTSLRDYRGHNPAATAMVLLSRYGNEPQKMIRLACMKAAPEVHASVLGAIAGGLYGKERLTAEMNPSERISNLIEPMLPLIDVAADKFAGEKRVIIETEKVSSEICPDGSSLLYNKVLGCILAGAIGNAMGSPVEGKMYHEIDAIYPDGIKTVLEPWRLETEDDNQVAMMLYEAYISKNGLPATACDYGEQWKRLMDKDMFFYCLRNTYELLNSGMDARICGQWNLVTGSSVMCMEPVGVYHIADIRNAYIDGTAMSYMNQRGLDVTAAAILAAATAGAMRKDATAESVVCAALEVAPKAKMLTFDKRAIDTPYDFISKCVEVASKYDDVFAARKELYEKCLCYHCIDPLELLGFSFAMLYISKGDVRTAAIGGTNIGRDSDTIAGRAAMLAGTISGYQNIPQEWVDMVNRNSLERIKTNSQKIVDLIAGKKLPLMKERHS
ncbi:MAG: ADP-ribosylglycohydrolase family protein [Oscillospiraceae bacterium]|nr:ADP-ribosylglycohydrolase family protein [Oscillospiraceae bacterium]